MQWWMADVGVSNYLQLNYVPQIMAIFLCDGMTGHGIAMELLHITVPLIKFEFL